MNVDGTSPSDATTTGSSDGLHIPDTDIQGLAGSLEPSDGPGDGSYLEQSAAQIRPAGRWITVPVLHRIDPPGRLAGIAVLLALVAGILVTASVIRAPRLSALDEATHLDYAWQIAHGSVPRSGDLLGQYTLDTWSCHRQANVPVAALPACDSLAPAARYPARGINYNTFHPPLYYALTGLTAGLISLTGADFFTTARLLGMIWLFAGMFGMYLVLRYWTVSTRVALQAALTVASIPVLLHASSIVTNDAPAALSGAGALYVLGRVLLYERTGWVLPVVLAGLASATKTLNGLGFLAVSLLLLGLGLHRWRRSGSRAGRALVVIGAGMGTVVVTTYLGWQLIQRFRSARPYISAVAGVHSRPLRGNPLGEWLSTEFTGFGIGRTYYLDPAVDGRLLTAWVAVFSVLSTAAAFMVIAVAGRSGHGRAVALAGSTALIGTLLYPLMVQGQAWVSSGGRDYFPVISTRYGISLLPLILGCMALAVARRGWWRVGWLISLSGLTAVLLTTL